MKPVDSVSLRCLLIPKKSWQTLKIGRALFRLISKMAAIGHIGKWTFDRLTIQLSAIGLFWLYWWWQIHFQYHFCNLRSISPYIPTLAILNERIIDYVWNNSDMLMTLLNFHHINYYFLIKSIRDTHLKIENMKLSYHMERILSSMQWTVHFSQFSTGLFVGSPLCTLP